MYEYTREREREERDRTKVVKAGDEFVDARRTQSRVSVAKESPGPPFSHVFFA